MRVLVVNAGSSSVRLRMLDGDDRVLADEHVERRADNAQDVIGAFVAHLDEPPDAVGHRVVHGGSVHRAPVVVDGDVEETLLSLTPLAPLHQPAAVAVIRTVRAVLPAIPAVACFDTAFHSTLPSAAATYAVPLAWRERWDLRRFGFHGLSHAYASRRAAQLLRARAGDGGARIVTCHLGAGASVCATVGGVSVDTTMGFTPMEGLVMATRSGSVDPGLVLWLLDGRLDRPAVTSGLEREGGLAALAGGSGDMREVLARRAAGDERAAQAFDVYIHHLAASIAAMTASTGGLDALVFTGGVGEHEPEVRHAAVERLGHLGLALAADANAAVRGATDADVSAPGAMAATYVIEAREDLEIAAGVRAVLAP